MVDFKGIHTLELSSQALPLIALALTLLTGLFSGAVFFGYTHYKARLHESQGPRLSASRALVSPTPWRAYINRLNKTLDHLDCWMGRLDQPHKLFHWCIVVAFIYPIALFLLGWLVGAPHSIGATNILPATDQIDQYTGMLIALAALLITSIVVVFIITSGSIAALVATAIIGTILSSGFALVGFVIIAYFINIIILALSSMTFSLANHVIKIKESTISIFVFIYFLLTVLAFFSLFGLMMAFFLSVGLGVVLVLYISSLAAHDIGMAREILIVIGAVVLAGLVLLGNTPLDDVGISTWMLFWVILPFINSIFDWASWWVSRCLGRNLIEVMDQPGTSLKKRFATFVKDISIDLIVALFLLISLAWTIPRIINLWNRFVVWQEGGKPPLELATYLCAAAKAPLTDGLWATGMLFSTLIPTVAHLTLLLLAFLLWPFQPRTLDHQRAAHILENHRPPAKDLAGVGREMIEQTWPKPALAIYAIPADIDQRGAYAGGLHSDTVNALSWKLGVRRPAYYLLAFAGLCSLLYLAIGSAFASWQPLPKILLMVAGFTKGEAESCLAI